jgi:hypothetical protein
MHKCHHVECQWWWRSRQDRGTVWIDMIWYFFIWSYIFHVVAEIEVIVIGITKGWPKTVYQ